MSEQLCNFKNFTTAGTPELSLLANQTKKNRANQHEGTSIQDKTIEANAIKI